MASAIDSSTLQTYSDFQPSGFDVKGLGLADRQDWLVGPVTTNRDAGCLQRSNWEVVTEDIAKADPDGTDHEKHSFNHWACGWFEIVIVRPGSKAHECAAKWECALSDYPVASDHHFSDLETNEIYDYWAGMSASERVYYLRKAGLSGRRWASKYPPEECYEYLNG
jgi:hypothetical protein